jgi:hypothetical protein
MVSVYFRLYISLFHSLIKMTVWHRVRIAETHKKFAMGSSLKATNFKALSLHKILQFSFNTPRLFKNVLHVNVMDLASTSKVL